MVYLVRCSHDLSGQRGYDSGKAVWRGLIDRLGGQSLGQPRPGRSSGEYAGGGDYVSLPGDI